MEIQLLRLFNSVQVENKKEQVIDDRIVSRCIKNGYVLDPAIIPDDHVLVAIEKIIGISGEKANSTFHKSWKIVREADIETLVIQQVMHYITTYGFEAIGIYNESTVYIPNELLELPEITDKLPLVVIKALTKDEISEKIVGLASTGIALAQKTLDDIMVIVEANKYDHGIVEKIKNRELKALLFDYYNIVPTEPVEFLRHLISKLTGESLIIKNDRLIKLIKESNGKILDTMLKDAPKDLASIFYRYKPLLLAMKSISRNKTFFNRLRKKAPRLHKPLGEDYLNAITGHIKNDTLDIERYIKKLENPNVSIFRKIRLAYALNFRLSNPESVVYRVRSGRGWATSYKWDGDLSETAVVLDITLQSIADDMASKVAGKTFYIPKYIHYTVPSTEKQFTGHLPNGTWVSVPEDLIVGIHWTNTKRSIDLDLSMISEDGKIGWDGYYRSESRDVLFSGDITDAPKPRGATELFYIRKSLSNQLLSVNYYNFDSTDPVPCKIIIASEKAENFGKNYMVDVNNILCSANINITEKQTTLGLIASIEGENRVYFSTASIGKSITSSNNECATHNREYLICSLVNSIELKSIIELAGGTIITEKIEGDFINLSPEALDKTTIIDIIL